MKLALEITWRDSFGNKMWKNFGEKFRVGGRDAALHAMN